MTLDELLPVRLGMLRPTRQPKHSAPAEVDRLRLKLGWANDLIRTQRVQIDDAEKRNDWRASCQAKAEELVVKLQADVDDLTAERDGLAEELAALKRRFAAQLAADANTYRITVPPMVRDTSAIEDQATCPIPVHTLWEALGLGPVTDPGRATTR
ncbi:hypothetical protein [Streptomyces sp. NPDC058291]|uniref:hypothetical protein n=1 Tax=Streptomyces sp. NPDC058291 TaxID=3346427 RepID=UPI0036E17AA4